jgi:hypothetical protein
MNDQERQVIDDIFARLAQVANQPREPEAERYIADKVRGQPYAPYAMAQAIVVQEQALANLNGELEQLRAEVDRLQRQPQGGGILSGLFGGGARQSEPARPQGTSPWGRPVEPPAQPGYGYGMPQQPMPMGGGGGFGGGPWGQRTGGGFLQSAMTTAAGVAGGMMIANALSHAFGGENGAAGAAHGFGGFGGDAAGAGADGGSGSYAGITDSLYQNGSGDAAGQDDQGDDFAGDFGGDSGDDGDWT